MQYTLYHPDDLPFGGMEWEHLAQPNKKRGSKRRQRKSPSPERRALPQGQVDVSPERWKGMSKIMGDFRKLAQEMTDGPTSVSSDTRSIAGTKAIASTDGSAIIGVIVAYTVLMVIWIYTRAQSNRLRFNRGSNLCRHMLVEACSTMHQSWAYY